MVSQLVRLEEELTDESFNEDERTNEETQIPRIWQLTRAIRSEGNELIFEGQEKVSWDWRPHIDEISEEF